MAGNKNEEPQLKKRGEVWYVFWWDTVRKHERKESLGTKDHATAAVKFAEFIVRGPADQRARGGLPSLKATVEQVLDWYDANHVNTVAAPERQRFAMAALKRHFRNTPIGDVDIEASRIYRVARMKKSDTQRAVSASTVRRELGVLGAAAQHCLRWKKIKADELPQIELPPEPVAKAPWLTKETLRLIFSKADGELLDFCKLAYYWASRRAAVELMKKNQVDLRHGHVDLHAQGARRTKKRRPIVPIYPEIRPTVERLMASEGEYLFSRGRLGNQRDFYWEFRQFCIAHKIKAVDAPDDVPWPHLLRHSRATHMLMDGEDPYKVAKLLGDTLETVERVYGHHSIDYLATSSTVEEVA